MNSLHASQLPEGFIFLTDVDTTIIEDPRYSTAENFTGHVVPGYERKKIVCTKEAANALKNANTDLKETGYQFIVYDGYRPQKAVKFFEYWADYIKDESKKNEYYPYIDKKNIFQLGYIAKKSGHSRGSTFDLTIIKVGSKLKCPTPLEKTLLSGKKIIFLDDGTENMGSSFDLFDEVSHYETPSITEQEQSNRKLLRDVMISNGFEPYEKEWWHFTLKNEPYPNTYFDF